DDLAEVVLIAREDRAGDADVRTPGAPGLLGRRHVGDALGEALEAALAAADLVVGRVWPVDRDRHAVDAELDEAVRDLRPQIPAVRVHAELHRRPLHVLDDLECVVAEKDLPTREGQVLHPEGGEVVDDAMDLGAGELDALPFLDEILPLTIVHDARQIERTHDAAQIATEGELERERLW